MKTNSPSRTIKITIAPNVYEVKYPNIGQTIDIESRKTALSNGQYGAMIDSNTVSAAKALAFINMASFFSILIPDLQKDLRIDSMLDLNPIEAKPLMDAFNNTFLPWFNEWQKMINESYTDKIEKEEGDEISK